MVAANLGFEAAWGSAVFGGSPTWPILQAGATTVALLVILERRHELRLPLVLAAGLVFPLAWIGVHLALGMPSDFDSAVVYPAQGRLLLSGHYPMSEYPPGAVLLFALETFLGGDSARISNAFLMVPFEGLIVAALWFLRSTSSRWLALLVAVWPLNAFSVEFKFDAVPTAFTIVGLLLALRCRWALAGMLFGLGSAVKWTPGLVAFGLVVWLVASRRPRDAARLGIAAGTAFLAINLPFCVANPAAVFHAYSAQGGRGITAESLPYLLLRPFGLAQPAGHVWLPADVPGWANAAAAGLQAVALACLIGVLIAVRGRLGAGVAVAAMLPVVFLLANRVFSPQYFIPLVSTWAAVAALTVSTVFRLRLLLGLATAASFCNAMIYPGLSRLTPYFSACLFASALTITTWLIITAARSPQPEALM
jgi:Glycosyltransferase family 87